MTDYRDPAPVDPAGPSSIADGVDRSLDPRFIDVARLVNGVATAVATFTILIVVVSITFAADPPRLVVLLLFAGWLLQTVLFGSLSWFWPRLRYRRISYNVDRLGIRIRRGVLWRSETSVPKSRVQHTDVSRGPIERAFGLATLVIYTAGTDHASVSLDGLTAETAGRIRDHLITGGDDDAV